MRDRVPGAPGQYQAVITAAEQQKLLAEEPFTITLTRDDHPVVEGTHYSKAAVLPDALAAALCPGLEDPTPADAFAALHKKALESEDFPGCYYRVVDGETEWINPPMVLGETYRTTGRYRGRPVYEKTMDLGVLPAGSAAEPGYKWTDIGVSASQILHWNATLRKGINEGRVKILNPLPYVAGSAGKVSANIYFNDKDVVLVTTENIENTENVNLWIRYTKEAV